MFVSIMSSKNKKFSDKQFSRSSMCKVLMSFEIYTDSFRKKTDSPVGLSLSRVVKSHTNDYPGSVTKLHLIMKLLIWSLRECGLPLRYHYSQLHSEPELLYLLGSHRSIK